MNLALMCRYDLVRGLSELNLYNGLMREALLHLRRTFKLRTLKLLVALAGWGAYATLFVLGFDLLGGQLGALALLPVALSAWLWGFRVGLAAAAASFFVNTLLFNLVDPALGGWDAVLQQKGGAGHVAVLFLGGVVGYLRDVRVLLHKQKKELLEKQKQLLHLAHHDPLTGLPNRALFMDRLERAVAQAKRSDEIVAVCFLDLNGFKEVNDTLGHAAGDDLLRQIAGRLGRRRRESDTLARMGGDEFTVIATGLKDERSVKRVAETLLDAFHLPFDIQGQAVAMSASMGLALHPQDGRSADELLQVADSAMYRVKRRTEDVKRHLTLH